MSAAPAVAENIIAFARALRAAGLKLGPGFAVDAVEAVETAGFSTREDFYWTLHAVLVKRHEDDPVFDSAFRLFWRRRDPKRGDPLRNAAAGAGRAHQKGGRAARAGSAATDGRKIDAAPAARADLTYDMRGTASDLEVFARKDFEQMSTAEILEARRRIARLAFAREEMPARRLVANPRGRRIDLRRTLRASLRAGGDLIDLKRRAAGTRRPPLVALLDISGSMSDYSRVVLHFLHALAETRGRVSTFVSARGSPIARGR